MRLISISIDLVGSTSEKNRIARICTTPQYAREQFELLAKLFYGLECRFYTSCLDEGVPFVSMFHMKAIGDEVWFVVEVQDGVDFNAVTVAVLRAAIATASRKVSFQFFKRALTAAEAAKDPPLRRLKAHRVNLPVKLYVDLIQDAAETSAIRLDSFLRDSSVLLKSAGGTVSITDLLERLGGVALVSVGETKVRVTHRTDYVGPEVDHFFRCTKMAEAGRVVAGRKLLRELTNPNGKRLRLRRDRRLVVQAGTESYRFSIKSRLVKRGTLKGITEPYEVFQVREKKIEQLMNF